MSHEDFQAATVQHARTDNPDAKAEPQASSVAAASAGSSPPESIASSGASSGHVAGAVAAPTPPATPAAPEATAVLPEPRVPSPMRALEQPVSYQSPSQTTRSLPPEQLAAASRGDRRSLLAFLRSRRIV